MDHDTNDVETRIQGPTEDEFRRMDAAIDQIEVEYPENIDETTQGHPEEHHMDEDLIVDDDVNE